MKRVILFIGMFMIILVSFCAVNQERISYYIKAHKIEKKSVNITENSFYVEDNFDFVSNYSDSKISNYDDLVNSIYYALNSGSNHVERYCDIQYKNCINDVKKVINDAELLSTFNNFIHPFNSFSKLEFSYDSNSFIMDITHSYSSKEIDEINNVIDEIIDKAITNDMSPRDKISAIHDYIIDNTDYDSLKLDNISDPTYSSNTAYGVLLQGKGICSGYSDAMAIFLNRLNIINYRISNDEHIWNYVYLNGQWYHLDLTWDDPISVDPTRTDSYFLITTEKLKYLNDNDDADNKDAHIYNSNIYKEAK